MKKPKLLGDVEEDKLGRNTEFLKEVTIFKDLLFKEFVELSMGMENINFKKNDVIFKEEDPTTGIYFIMNGDIEVLIKLSNNFSLNY